MLLGKALGGGILPVSAVLADDEIMLVIAPGEHGSTYGGNALACRLAMEALDILEDEKLAENAERVGKVLRNGLKEIDSPYIKEVRGKGLLCAIQLSHPDKEAAWKLCIEMMNNGLLAKPTQGDRIRFAPPLVISETQVKECLEIIARSMEVLD